MVSDNYEIIKQEVFDSKKKYMYTKIRMNGHTYNLVKGAYEVVGKMCNSYYDKVGIKHTIRDNSYIDRKIKSMSMNMMRILLLAINEDRETINNMTLVGFVILKDEVRENVKEGIRLVDEASIHTIMITGDNRETAKAVAEDIGLIKGSNDLVITSNEMIDYLSSHI